MFVDNEMYLLSSVVNLSEEVLGLIGISVSLKPEGKDGKVTNEKNSKKTKVINSEPLVGSLGGYGSGGGKDGGHESGGGGHSSLLEWLSSQRGNSGSYGCIGGRKKERKVS